MPPASSPWRTARIAASSTWRRGRKSGAGIIRAAAQWARGLGAETLYAQVASGNRASRALQESLGLREAYRYSYYAKPPGG
jgi:RimJ/RimL family protein N-acetyltransferase